MTATKRKLFLLNGGLGVLLTLAVVLLDHGGHLAAIENWFHSRRALDCQFFVNPPTDKLVFLDIDDAALDTVGRWPWNRSTMASILDEVAAARPQLVFLDIIYSEPANVEITRREEGGTVEIDHDKRLADAIGRAGNVLVPISTPDAKFVGETPLQVAAVAILLRDLELTPADVFKEIRARGQRVDENDEASVSLFLSARRIAMFRRIERELAGGPVTLVELRQRLLPRTDPRHINSPLLRLLVQQYERAEKLQPLRRFTRPPDPNLPSLLRTDEEKENAPLAMFGERAAASGFVDYISDPDGVVRRIALLELHRGRVVPQVGLVIACKLLGADPNAVSATQDDLTIRLPDGRKVRIPLVTRRHSETGKPIGALIDIPYIGPERWEYAFDHRGKRMAHHVPMNAVWQILQTREDILVNNATADRAITDLEELFQDDVAAYKARLPPPADHQTRLQVLAKFLESINTFLDAYKDVKNPDDTERQQIAALKHAQGGIQTAINDTRRLADQFLAQRDSLAQKLAGKAVLIGSVASGMVRDLKPTPLHDDCPGVVIHGFIANGILSGELWRSAPLWVTRLITLIVGLATTAIVLSLPPWKAALSALGFIAAYFVINGVILFDYNNTLVGVAGPVVAMAVTWSSCQLVEILVEKAERARITRRFAAYADPALVDWVVEHPEQAAMAGETREMTVVFTDLAGFTTLSEQLQEKIVPLLNEYLGIMSAIIHKHGGYVNKFLGDGVMFFFNAPKPNPNHAVDAATTVLEMQKAVEDFNQTLAARGLAPIAMRAGILTGPMVVGDAGAPERADYTVLGDNVNLASRLEGANKATGTSVLMTWRTAELLGDKFVWRPVAKLQVKGKTEHVITCELIAPADRASPEQKRLAECSKAVFDCFVQGQFDRCLDAVECMEQSCGPTHLSAVYRELSQQYITTPPTNGFDGSILLTEK